ncbi:MAG: hypothetical protein Q8P59_09590, partial [Dehalococcoidia bacterium]|nr:hypothetical protein [Dehalococcoidia bacterium]
MKLVQIPLQRALLYAILIVFIMGTVWPVPYADTSDNMPFIAAESRTPQGTPSIVMVENLGDGSFRYLVNGEPQVFIGMGYNPIYRYLSDEERAANYNRDFRILCKAGVNQITGWDADKGYEQD